MLNLTMSSCDQYYLSTLAKKIERRWAESGDDVIYYNPSIDKRTLYEKAFEFVKGYGHPNEYVTAQFYELNKYVYQKRMSFMISELRKRLNKKDKYIKFGEASNIYMF